jgi:hypothetical protein
MTPQERQLLNELFERLAALENAPRDPDAVDAINEGLDRAPNALYPLVQTVLVQDEALKRADARIRELEEQLGGKPPGAAGPQPGFLDGMRDTLLGRERQGSVPSVRQDAAPAAKWGSGTTLPPGYASQQQGGYGQPQPGYAEPPPQQQSAGGSFLGTAAATAAGAIGGAMLMNSMRGLFGGQGQGQGKGHSAFDQGGQGGAPWGGSGSGGDLARQAGVDDIGRGGGGGRTAAADDSSQRVGLFDTAQNDAESDDEYEDDDSDDVSDDTDTA